MPDPDFSLKLGDNASNIASTLENSGGTAISIQNASVRFKLAPLTGGTVTINAAATNAQNTDGSDGSKGNVLYNWGSVPGTVGFYLGEWEVTYAGGSVQTFPNDGYLLVNVSGDIR